MASVALTVSAVGLTTAPAQAAASICPAGYACLWADPGFTTDGGGAVRFYSYIPDLSLLTYPGTSLRAANTATSVSNNGNFDTVYLYTGTYKSGSFIGLARGDAISDLSAHYPFNDNIESGYFASYL